MATSPAYIRPFRFHVDFLTSTLKPQSPSEKVSLCQGAFAECTGLEATMEPKVIKQGGDNYGASQRAGTVAFATVVLKRGMTTNRNLWQWFEAVATGGYSYRLTVTINLYNIQGEAVMAWQLDRAMPIKFKAADLNAKAAEVGIEELHLAHEGLTALPAAKATRPTL
jgi:phage tail-like protein